MRLRRRSKSKTSRLAAAVATYLKFKAIVKLAKAGRTTLKGYAAYKTTKTVASKTPRPVKALPVVAGVGAVGAVAVRKRRQKEPAAAGAPTP